MGDGVLPVRGALSQIETALLDVIGLALGKRHPAVADIAALAAVVTFGASSSNSLISGVIRYVTADAVCYVWRATSTAATASGVVVPLDRVTPTKPGRWLIATSEIVNPDGDELRAVQSGYLKATALYQGERSAEEWDQRIISRRPAVMIQFTGETSDQASNLRGGLKVKRYHFAVWGISYNLRSGTEAALGSGVSAEAAADPGIVAIMADLEDLLDGTTGAELAVDGIDFLSFGDVSPSLENLSQREFMWSAPLDVRCTVGKEDRIRNSFDLAYLQPQHPEGVDYGPDSEVFPEGEE